ncbi:MAG: LPS assembly protein LptD [Planctomycetota bacterium]
MTKTLGTNAAILFAFLGSLAWMVGTSAAQGQRLAGVKVDFEADLVDFYLEDGRAHAVGNVVLTWEGSRLRCDNAVIWLVKNGAPDTDAEEVAADGRRGGVTVSEIYAEGVVVLSRYADEQVFRCHRLFFDLVSNRGTFWDAALRQSLDRRGEKLDLVMRAGELRQLSRDRYEMFDTTFTTNPSVEPGYRLVTPSARVEIDEKAVDRQGNSYRNVRFELDSSVLYIGELPILKTPPFSGQTKDRGGNLYRRIEVDSSKKFGPSARLTLGKEIWFDDERWGDLEFYGQYFGKRGLGGGIDLRYEQTDYRGSLRGVYQRDRGRDELFNTPTDKDRGRVLLRHRHQLPEHIQLDIELSKISDRGFLSEYYENEFQSDKEQETLIYAKRAVGASALTFLANTRLNDFQTQTEFLPRASYQLISYPLIDIGNRSSLYFDARYEVSNARLRFDDELHRPNARTYRADFDQTVALPFFLGPVKIEPFVGFRYTRYGRGALVDESFDRIGNLYGARATTQLSRTFDARGGLFNLDGLRHIVTPSVEYRNISHVSHSVDDFIPFDDVELFTEREELVFRLRNRLQTQWHDGDNSEVVDLIDLDLKWTFFPSAERDNFGHHVGNLDVEADFRLSPELIWSTDFEYSFVLDELEIFNTTLGWAPRPSLLLAAGYRRFVGVNDAIFVTTQWRASQKLGIQIYSGYDFVEDDLQDQRLTIQRFGEDWVFEFEFEYDNRGGVGFGIAIRPRALFDPRLRVRSIRNEPHFDDFKHEHLR